MIYPFCIDCPVSSFQPSASSATSTHLLPLLARATTDVSLGVPVIQLQGGSPAVKASQSENSVGWSVINEKGSDFIKVFKIAWKTS